MDNKDKGTNKKLWLIIVMIVVIVILLGVIAFLSGKDHSKAISSKVVKTVKVESATTRKSQSQVASSMNNSHKPQSSSELILGFKLVL